jgi:hypothetical protein
MRFSKTNLCCESYTTVSASSENVNFPALNLSNPLRSKRWRSKGFFEINSTNNKINFKEASLGSELTATLTVGVYSTASLILEIKTKMELVGVNDYTVTLSGTTGLWTVTSSGLFFSLLNNTGTNQVNSLFKNALGFPNTDKTGAVTYTGSNIAIHTIEYVTFDFQSPANIKNVVLFWPKEDGLKLTPNAVIKIQANATDVWTSPSVDQTMTLDDLYEVASHFFTADQSYRYWRVVIQDPQNPYLYIELGLAFIGEDIGFSAPEQGFKFTIIDQTVSTRTPFGQEYNDIYPQYTILEFDYKYMFYEDLLVLEDVFRENGSYKQVLVVFDETEIVFNDNHYLIYGTLEKSFENNHISLNMFNGKMKITETC